MENMDALIQVQMQHAISSFMNHRPLWDEVLVEAHPIREGPWVVEFSWAPSHPPQQH